VNIWDVAPEAGELFTCFDRGYVEFAFAWMSWRSLAFFVTRAKTEYAVLSAHFRPVERTKRDWRATKPPPICDRSANRERYPGSIAGASLFRCREDSG